MAELPHPPGTHGAVPTHFPSVALRVDGGSVQLQRLDIQAAVDLARARNIAARHALVAASTSVMIETGPIRVAADSARAVLRAAVDVLTAFDATHGGPVPAKLRIDVLPDGATATTVVRPHGEVDLFTSPHLEQVCVAQIEDGPDLRRLMVDLSEVTFLDSSGLAVLIELHRVTEGYDTAFVVTGANTRTRRLLSITRLDTVLHIE